MTYRINSNGEEEHLDENGHLHNPNGWAIKMNSGTRVWCIHGEVHREDGPAIEGYDGNVIYCLNDKGMTKKEWEQGK